MRSNKLDRTMTTELKQQAHTPGPWFPIQDTNGSNRQMLVCNGEDFGNYVIADCGRSDSRVAQANARLIAAAPELLEGIQDLLFTIDLTQVPAGEQLRAMNAAIKKCERAIAKATGGGQ